MCKKKRYRTYFAALGTSLEFKHRVYFCPKCRGYHLTHLSEAEYVARAASFDSGLIKLHEYDLSLSEALAALQGLVGLSTRRSVEKLFSDFQFKKYTQPLKEK